MARVLCGIWVTMAVFGVVDRIQKALEKGDYEKARELIYKGYEKEPNNPGIHYYHSVLLFDEAYTGFHADSARLQINLSIDHYQVANEDELKEMREAGLNQEVLEALAQRIQEYQYEETIKGLTISTIQDFRSKYPASSYDDALIFKRDSILFRGVKMENTPQQYENFMRNYHGSVFIAEADPLLDDRLRFIDLQMNGKLDDYLSFRGRYPTTRWMREVESYILLTSTATHELSKFREFIRISKTADLKVKAANVHYYLDKNSEIHPRKDSINELADLSRLVLFPTMDRGKFGLHSLTGNRQIPYSYDEIQEQSKCDFINDDWIWVKEGGVGKIILKNGRISTQGG